jgi:hypothetical protein
LDVSEDQTYFLRRQDDWRVLPAPGPHGVEPAEPEGLTEAEGAVLINAG